MRWKTTLVLLVAVFGIGAYISLYELKQPLPEERERLSKEVVAIPAESVTQLVLDLPQAKVTLTKDGTTWKLSPQGQSLADARDPSARDPEAVAEGRADEALVNKLLDHTADLTAERTLSGPAKNHPPLDLKPFGLEPPVGTLSLTSKGTTTTLLIGETTAVHNNRYLKVADRPTVYIVSSSLFDDANQPTDTLRDPVLLRLNASLANELTIKSPAASFSLTRHDTTWSLRIPASQGEGTTPLEDLAERTEVNALLGNLGRTAIKRFLTETPKPDEAARWGFDQPKAEIALVQQAEPPLTLLFGKPLEDDKTLVYAKRSDEPILYAVAATDVDALVRDPHGLRARGCVEFFTNDVMKVSVSREGGGWAIEKSNGQWREAGATAALSTQAVEEFLNKLSDLRLSGFVDDTPTDLKQYGLDPPAGSIAVSTMNREQPQRLLVGSVIEGSANRYGRIEGRHAVVRLPELISDLLATAPDRFRPAAKPASTSAAPPQQPVTPPSKSP